MAGKLTVQYAHVQSRHVGNVDESGSLDLDTVQVDEYFLPGTLALPSLRSLIVVSGHLQDLPPSVAREMKSLTHLCLRGNKFARIPAAASMITTLQRLDLSFNADLQLEHSDVDLLSELPCLQHLRLAKKEIPSEQAGWSQRSTGVLIALKGSIPHLDLAGFE